MAVLAKTVFLWKFTVYVSLYRLSVPRCPVSYYDIIDFPCEIPDPNSVLRTKIFFTDVFNNNNGSYILLNYFSESIPMLIKDGCSSCNKDQKKTVKKAIDTIKSLRSSDYEKLAKFFDPDGHYTKKFMENLEV